MAQGNFNQRLNGLNPLAYLGDNARQPSEFYSLPRAPTVNDTRGYFLGDRWLNTANEDLYYLGSFSEGGISGRASWNLIAGGGGSMVMLTGDDAVVVNPTGGNINVFGGDKAGARANPDVVTTGLGSTLFVDLTNTILLGDLANVTGAYAIGLVTGDITLDSGSVNLSMNTNAAATVGMINIGGYRFISNYGTENTFIGENSGNTTLNVGTAFQTTGVGTFSLMNLTTGFSNSALGYSSLNDLTTGYNNVAVGSQALELLTIGYENVAVGENALGALVTGYNNTAIGHNAGIALGLGDFDNILIANDGVPGDIGEVRIGTFGTHNAVYIAGIDGVDVGNVAKVVTVAAGATDQLGQASIVGGVGVTVTPTANTITISASGITDITYTAVNTSPYVVLATDAYISVDSSGGAIIVQLPDAPVVGQIFYIKDRTGSAAAFNITVTTVSGATLIDGAATFVMNTAYESVSVIGSATAYEIF